MKNSDHFAVDFNDLDLNSSEIACEIGYGKDNIPEYIEAGINELINEFKSQAEISAGYVIHDSIKINSFDIIINDVRLNTSGIISKALLNSEQIAVFACSAGQNSDKIIKAHEKDGDMMKTYLADIVGSYVAERSAELISKQLKSEAFETSLKTTNRFSPGYCNWNVSEQKELFSLLPKDFCGIQLNEYALMIPIKSVSGIIGIGEQVKDGNYFCSDCTKSDCLFFKN